MNNQNLEHALAYLDAGFSIIPLTGKKPAVESWRAFMTALPSKDRVERCWTEHPEANIGIVTGKISGVTVLDLDAKGDEEMMAKFKKEFPSPLTVKTGGGGLHAYFRYVPVKNAVRIPYANYPLDLRSDGGYVVAPPSIHPITGVRYHFDGAEEFDVAMISGLKDFLPEMPQTITDLMAFRNVSKLPSDWREIIYGTIEGSRNQSAAMLFGKLMQSLPPMEWYPIILPLIVAWNNQNVKPPLDEKEIYTIFQSIAKSELARREKEKAATFKAQQTKPL